MRTTLSLTTTVELLIAPSIPFPKRVGKNHWLGSTHTHAHTHHTVGLIPNLHRHRRRSENRGPQLERFAMSCFCCTTAAGREHDVIRKRVHDGDNHTATFVGCQKLPDDATPRAHYHTAHTGASSWVVAT